MKNGRLAGILIFGIIALVIVLLTTYIVRAAYQRALGPALQPIQPTAIPTTELLLLQTATPTPTQAPPAATAAIVQAGVCGETSAWNLLVLGADTVALRGDKGSDLTRLIRVDFPNRRVTIYAFSRDLWVNTSGLGLTNPTIDATELGTVFYEGYRRSTKATSREAMLDATNVMARMLAWNFSVGVDHYMTIDMIQVPAMIDAIGGLPVNIPERTTDPWIGMVIQPGQQTLSGAQASAYARAKPDSDFGRINRQKILVDALRRKLLDPAVWARIPALYAQYNQVIATDLSPEQINHLACLLNEVPAEAVIQEGVPQTWTSPGPAGSYLWDKNSVLNQLRTLGLIP